MDLIWNAILATKARSDEPVETVEANVDSTDESDQQARTSSQVKFEKDIFPVLMDELVASVAGNQIRNGTDATVEELEPATPLK